MQMRIVILSLQTADAKTMAGPAEKLRELGIEPDVYAINSDDADDDILVYQELVRRTRLADLVYLRCMSDTNRFKRYDKYEKVLEECKGYVLVFSGNAEVTMMKRALFKGSDEEFAQVSRYAASRGPENDLGMMKWFAGAMDAWGEGVREIEVEDPGVLLDTNTKMDYESLLAYEKDRQKRGELAFRASISLSREEECFSALTADFLEAVAESGSMLGACQIRDISYSKGWKMLKIAEAQLGIQFLERQMGGSKGGFSVLTPEGKVFLEKFRRMEAAVQAAAEAAFEKIFLEPEEEEKEDTDGREINAF